MPPDNESRPAGNGAAETRTWESAVKAENIAPFRLTSCASTCPDCYGTGAIGLHPCTRQTQYVRRVAWSYWADIVLSDRRAA